MPPSLAALLGLLAAAAVAPAVRAHGDHSHAPHAPVDESVPIDAVLWTHIALQTALFLVVFPLVMVLGLTRSRLHVPLAVGALALCAPGYVMGQHHGGRRYFHTVHGSLAGVLLWYMAAQALMGVYLKLHLSYGARWLRPAVLRVHGIVGFGFPVLGWTQMLFGIITLRSWCFGGALGQCVAHHLMGSAFCAYAVLLLLMCKTGVAWLRRRRCSQEMIDSSVIAAWGLVNAFTEHHGGPWTHKDLQHTLLGVMWVFGGLAGIWTSRGRRRSAIPGVVILLTGWAMSGHAQELMISTMIHALFGYTLMAAGICKIIEVCFVLHDEPTGEPVDESPEEEQQRLALGHGPGETWWRVRAFQYMTPWLLMASGVLFMSGTNDELQWADSQGVDHITWGLIDFSLSLGLFFWANVLIDLYTSSGGRSGAARNAQRRAAHALGGGGMEAATRDGSSSLYQRLARASLSTPRGVAPLAGREAESDDGSFEMGSRGGGGKEEEQTHVLFDEQDGDEDAESTGLFSRH